MAIKALSQITFLYYQDLQPVAEFYEEIMGFNLIQDQGIAKIYRVSGDAYLGIVDGAKGRFRPQEHNAVLITLVVDDLPEWHNYLQSKNIKPLSKIKHGAHISHFFCKDPGGYTIEVQTFLEPEVAKMSGT